MTFASMACSDPNCVLCAGWRELRNIAAFPQAVASPSAAPGCTARRLLRALVEDLDGSDPEGRCEIAQVPYCDSRGIWRTETRTKNIRNIDGTAAPDDRCDGVWDEAASVWVFTSR